MARLTLSRFHSKHIAVATALFACVIALSPRIAKATAVGVTQGKLSADLSGGLSYDIPIVVSPGTAGMQPKLSFHYSSGGRNGALGVGWSVAGVSAITRAPQTLAQDGAIHGVDMTYADRYSMDGQRLIAIVGTDGYSGAEYRTEINSFTKIVSNGISGNGPSTFTAWTKSGLIYTFGGGTASFIPVGRTDGTILTWLVSKVQDQAGNYMTFSYTTEGNVNTINYTMNDAAALGGYASVTFNYDPNPRPDPATGYVVGSSVSMTKRLQSVVSKYGTQIVRQYDLAYDLSATTSKSLLRSITEGNGAGLTFPPTTFNWWNDQLPDGDPATLAYSASLVSGILDNNHSMAQGDFDGDGICDVIKARQASSVLQVYKIQNGQLVTAGSYTSSQNFTSSNDTWLQGDFNGDGKLDVIRVHSSGDVNGGALIFTQFLNTGTNAVGTAFTQSNATLTGFVQNWYPSRTYVAADVNGDGKLDIIAINGPDPQTGNAQAMVVTAFLNQGSGTFNGVQWNYTSAPNDPGATNKDNCKSADQWMAIDFNGDGLPDLVKVMSDNNKTSVRVYQNLYQNPVQGGSFLAKTLIFQNGTFYKSDNTTPGYKWLSGDFNGDGLTDLVRVPELNNRDNATTATVWLSTGLLSTGLTTGTAWLTIQVSDKDDLQTGDYNADGRSDLVVVADVSVQGQGYESQRSEYLSNGVSGFYLEDAGTLQLPVGSQPNNAKNLTADFNGDGKEDLIRAFGTTSGAAYFNIYSSTPGYHDLLRKVTDGMGVATSIDYQPLTNAAVFTKSTDAVAPAIDLIVPMPVVATITYDNGLGAVGSPGSTYTVSYRYEGLKADPQRGMLGFRSVEAIDNRGVDGETTRVLHTKTWLKQGFPYTGMAERSATYLLDAGSTKSFNDVGNWFNGLLSLTTTTYAAGPTENTKVYFPYAQDSHVYAWDLGTTAVVLNDTETIVPTTGGVDVYGNTLQSTIQTKDGNSANYFVKTTTSQYEAADTTKWCIGHVISSSVTSQEPGPSIQGQNPITRTSGFSYNPANCEVSSENIEQGSMQTTYGFDAFGNTQTTTVTGNDMPLPAPSPTPSPYDPTRITTTNYDAKGRFVATTINAKGQTETKTYDERFGAGTSVTGPNGLTDSASYDDFGRKKSETRLSNTANSINTQINYEWVSGNANPNTYPPTNTIATYLVRVTPADGPETISYFDRLGRELRKQTTSGSGCVVVVDTTYDYRGRKSTISKPNCKDDSATVATSFYDALDRLVQIQVPSVDETGVNVTAITTTTYNGLAATVTNPKGQQTTSLKDGAGRVRVVTDALGGVINYTYDAVGQLTYTSDSAGNTTAITYDVRGRKMTVNDPDLGLWSYHYYSTGEVKDQTDANGNVLHLYYDKLGRMTERDEPLSDITTWTYDTATGKGIGKLASVQFTPHFGSSLAPYSNVLTYDTLGRLSSQSTTAHTSTYVSSTAYDQFSRPSTLTYPTGFVVKNLYNVNGYLKQITNSDATVTFWQANNFDADGHITSEQYGNGIVTDRVYIPQNGLLKTIKSGLGGGTGAQNLEYHFDVLGNLKSRKDNNQTVQGSTLEETFNYDPLNRLINWTATGQPQQSATYDLLGNILSKSGVGTYTYPAAGSAHPHAVLSAGNSGNATYDANGNMQSGFNRSVTWTWFNQPQLITGSGGSSYFEYDDNHQRVWQHTASVDTTYVGGFYEKVDDADTTKHKCYINAPTGRVAIYTQTYDKHTFGTTYDTKYLHKDHLGSVDVITDATGAILERDSFDAWGFRRTTDWQAQRAIGCSMSIVTRGFTGHEELDCLGLVNMNGRIYDPGIGRFLSADPYFQFPFNTQNFNRYSYVLNNPLSFTDPSGFSIWDWAGAALGSVFKLGVDIVRWATGNLSTNALITGVCSAVAYFALSYVGPWVATVGAGFTSAFVSTLLAGGTFLQAVEAGTITGAIAAATYGLVKYGLPALVNAMNPGTTAATAQQGVAQKGYTFAYTSWNIQSEVDAGRVCVINSEDSLSAVPATEGLPEATAQVVVRGSAIVGNAAPSLSHMFSETFFNALGASVFNFVVPYSDPLLRLAIGDRNTNFGERWAIGAQPSHISYSPDSPETLDMQQSPGADLMRADFNRSGGQFSSTRYDTGRAYWETIADPSADRHSTALQVGGFDRATVVNNGDGTATFTIRNTAGAHSLFLHLPFVHDNPFGPWGPMHNVYQTFEWTEPYNPGP